MTDWPPLIEFLERRMSHMDIGLEVGISEGSVGRLKRREIKEPKHRVGAALIVLAERHGYVSCETAEMQVRD